MLEPKLPLTVSRKLWDAFAEDIRPEFADSYLSGALETASSLIPHTVTAYLRIRQTGAANAILRDMGLKLIEPLPYGHRDRPDSPNRMAAE